MNDRVDPEKEALHCLDMATRARQFLMAALVTEQRR
jgi:hypothetical protein